MKHITLTLLIIMLATLAVNIVGAQDVYLGTAIQTIASAELDDNDDGTFTLTLTEADDFLSVFATTSAGIFTGRYDAVDFVRDWFYAPEQPLTASAQLTIEEQEGEAIRWVMAFTISANEYHDEQISFTVTDISITGYELVNGATEIVEGDPANFKDFDNASLFIILDRIFAGGLVAGRENWPDDVRLTGGQNTCPNGLTC